MKPVDEEQELTRLLAQETSPLAASLEALRDHGPDAAELASLASRLALVGLDVSVPQPAARANRWRKWGWGGLVGLSAALVWWAARGAAPVPPAMPVPRASGASELGLVVPAGRATAALPSATTLEARNAPRQEPTAGVEAASATAASALTTTSAVASSSPIGQHEGVAGAAAPAGDAQGSSKSPTQASTASPRITEAPLVANGAVDRGSSTGSLVTASEIELLRDARLALHSSPERALELTDEHRRLYPHGKMTQERELIAVSALVALGRRAAALSRAASFERQYPTSPYRKQMGDLLR